MSAAAGSVSAQFGIPDAPMAKIKLSSPEQSASSAYYITTDHINIHEEGKLTAWDIESGQDLIGDVPFSAEQGWELLKRPISE